MKEWDLISGEFDKFKELKDEENTYPVSLVLISKNSHCKVNKLVLHKSLKFPISIDADPLESQPREIFTDFSFNCKDKNKFEAVEDKFSDLLSVVSGLKEFVAKELSLSIYDTRKFFSEELDELFKFLELDEEMISFFKENLLFRVLTARQESLYEDLQTAFNEETQNIDKIKWICSELSQELGSDEVFYDIGEKLQKANQHEDAEWFLNRVGADSAYNAKAHFCLAHIELFKLEKLKSKNAPEKELRAAHRKAIEHFMLSIRLMEGATSTYQHLMDYADIPLSLEVSNDPETLFFNMIFTLADSNYQLSTEIKNLKKSGLLDKFKDLETQNTILMNRIKYLEAQLSTKEKTPQTLTTYYNLKREENKQEEELLEKQIKTLSVVESEKSKGTPNTLQ